MKNIKYLRYVLRHKWYVAIECFRRGLYWRGIMHDMSKFFPSEFFPYAEYFYGEERSREFFKFYPKYVDMSFVPFGMLVEDKFNIAWLHHQNRNKHHWQYWILTEDSGREIIIPMPEPYFTEMICDWIGAGKAQGKFSPKSDPMKETREWYLKNRDEMKFNPKTKHKIEEILGVVED